MMMFCAEFGVWKMKSWIDVLIGLILLIWYMVIAKIVCNDVFYPFNRVYHILKSILK